MIQSKLESLVEAILNTLSGFIISLLTWMFIVSPIWGIENSFTDSLSIVGLFTVISILRSYIWRRFFNNGLHKVVHNLFKGR